MINLCIGKTEFTPSVIFDKSTGVFEISGKSLPEDPFEFYVPLINWFNSYLKNPNPKTVLKFDLIYFNTASAKLFFELLNSCNRSYLNGTNIEVAWYFDEEDEDIMEAGEDFASLLDMPFVYYALAE